MSILRRFVYAMSAVVVVVGGLSLATSIGAGTRPAKGSSVSRVELVDASPGRPLDAPDWPTAIDADLDGTVWLAMATDVVNKGGVAYYSGALEYEGGWGVAGSPHAVAVGPSRDVYVDENEPGPAIVSRFTTGGSHTQSWEAGGYVIGLAAAPNGDLIELRGAPGDPATGQEIVAFGSTGKLLDSWEAPSDSLSLATDRRGHVFVGQRTGNAGAIWHYSMSGTRLGHWTITSQPMGVDMGPDDRLYVAGQYGTSRGDVTIWERDGSFVDGILVDAQPEDVAVGPDGSVYVIVWLDAEGRREVRKYDSDGNLLIRLEDIHPVQGLPRPPTATPGPPVTAPTPWWPSATPRPATATPTSTGSVGTPATPSPSATVTSAVSPTPGEESRLYVPLAAVAVREAMR
jgi:hypothetical protein